MPKFDANLKDTSDLLGTRVAGPVCVYNGCVGVDDTILRLWSTTTASLSINGIVVVVLLYLRYCLYYPSHHCTMYVPLLY